MTRTKTPTGRCQCGQPAEIGPHTTRSRYGGTPLCGDCSTLPPVHFETRSPNLAEGHCDNCKRVDFMERLTKVGASHFCPQCLHDHLYPGEPSPHRSAEAAGEVRMLEPDPDGEVRHVAVGDYYLTLPARAYTQEQLDEIESRGDEIAERVVEAYACRFNVPVPARTEDGRACFIRYAPSAFDAQLAETDDRWPPLLYLDHGGRGYGGERRDGLRDAIGQVFNMAADGYGLAVTALVDSTPAGWAVHSDMVDGSLPAFSSYVIPVRMLEVGEYRGAPYFEITEGWLMECGPTDAPADPGCEIRSVGGEAPLPPDFTEAGRSLAQEWLSDPSEWVRARRRVEAREARRYDAAEGVVRAAEAIAAIAAVGR